MGFLTTLATIMEMNCVLGQEFALHGYTGPGITWANEISLVMNHATGTGSIARPVGQQSSALPLCYRRTPSPQTEYEMNVEMNKKKRSSTNTQDPDYR